MRGKHVLLGYYHDAAPKVIGRFPGETSCLTLVSAVLDLYITHATDGIKFTQLERQHRKGMRYEGDQESITEDITARMSRSPWNFVTAIL